MELSSGWVLQRYLVVNRDDWMVDFDTGEILDLPAFIRREKKVAQAQRKPYKVPVVPVTKDELIELQKEYGVKWHILTPLDLDALISLPLTMTDLRVLSGMREGIVYNNYSHTSKKDIMEKYSLGKSAVYSSIAKLKELCLIISVSDEIDEIHPGVGWVGDHTAQQQKKIKWLTPQIRVGYDSQVDWLCSDEYAELVRREG